MARTILDIYDLIISDKETKTSLQGLAPNPETSANLLTDLTSDSRVAVWRLWAYVIAVAIHIHEVAFDLFKAEAEKIAAAAPAGTPRWYQKKMQEFQYGDNLIYLDNQYRYDPIDPAHQIIKSAAIEERGDGVVVVKVAKGDPLEPLTAPELLAIESYAHKIKFAGTRLVVSSLAADQLTIVYDIYYDPIIPLSELKIKMQESVDLFLSTLPFNAAFNVTKFTDILQLVEGVRDPIFISAETTALGNTIPFTIEDIAAAGWFELANPVDTLFNFIPRL